MKVITRKADGHMTEIELLGEVAPEFIRVTPPAALSLFTQSALAKASMVFRRVDKRHDGITIYQQVISNEEVPRWRRRKFSQKTI